MTTSFLVLVAMTVVVALIGIYRWIVTHHEGYFLHIEDPTGQLAANERRTAGQLDHVDRIGIGLTIATAAYGLILLVLYLVNGLK